jgi:hypothetical protein
MFRRGKRLRRQRLALCLIATALSVDPATASTIYAGSAATLARGISGFTQLPEGSLATLDLTNLGAPSVPSGFSANPSGTTLVADVFNPPAGLADGSLTGLAVIGGQLYASTFECDASAGCFEGPSRLLRIDPAGGVPTEIGLIREGATELFIYDLAVNPTNGLLYGVSSFFGSSCATCLYTIDPATGAATRIGVIPLGFGFAGGLAFAPDGTLYLTTISPIAGPFTGSNRNALDFVTLNAATGQIITREDLLIEQQFIHVGGGVGTLIKSIVAQGLMVTADGRIIASGDNGNTMIYERVFGQALSPTGAPVGAPGYVWRRLGDSGENLGDLVEFVAVPEAGFAWLAAVGAALLAARRARTRRS